MSPDDVLTFELDAERLNEAIVALAEVRGETTYPVVWHALTTEACRRRDSGAPLPISIRRAAFEELPMLIGDILDVRVAAVACSRCGHSNPVPAYFLELQCGTPLITSCRSCERAFEVC